MRRGGDVPERVALIMLESADKDLIGRWMGEGRLKNLAAFAQKSLRMPVRNAESLESGSLFPCFYYGGDPSFHRQYDGTRHFNPASYRHDNYAAGELTAKPLWTVLSEAGRRSILIDTPLIPLPEQLNGIALFDWLVHSSRIGGAVLDTVSSPPEFAAKVLAEYGSCPLGGATCDIHAPKSAEDVFAFRDALLKRIRMKTALSRDLLAGEPWDFFVTVFADAHCGGHHLWRFHDPSHPDHDPSVGDPLRDVYEALDAAVGELLTAIGDDVVVLVHLTHGIGPGYTATRLLDRILARLDGHPIEQQGRLRDLLRRAWREAPGGLRKRLAPLYVASRPVRQAIFHKGFVGDFEKRRFFEVFNNDRTGAVRINLEGRESHGLVPPGDYDAVCERLTRDLLEIVNVETGQPLVERVVRSHDAFHGPHVDALPDLLVTWNRSAPIRRVASPRIGEIVHRFASRRNGDHRPEGALMATGPGIRAAAMNEPVDIFDLAPTITQLLGAGLSTFQGRPIAALSSQRT